MLLIGDVGGTKTDLAIVDPGRGPADLLHRKRLSSGEYGSLAALVRHYLADTTLRPEEGCFAVAGPVRDGTAQLTNLPWHLDEPGLAKDLGFRRVVLLNDLAAIASAVPALAPEDYRTLRVGKAEAHGSLAVVAPGTGLGEAFLTWAGAGYRAHPAEGGHADFPAVTPLDVELLAFLRARFGRVSVERVCSGLGIAHLHEFLVGKGETDRPEVKARLESATDRTPIIVEAGLEGSPACRAALEYFVDVLAREAGNYALKVFATGGVYLAGGIPPRLGTLLDRPEFLATFEAKGRMAPVLRDVPVHVVTGRLALRGAATFYFQGGSR